MENINFAKDLIEFIYDSPTSFHAIATSKALLDKNGFKELKMNEKWRLEEHGKYYVTISFQF